MIESRMGYGEMQHVKTQDIYNDRSWGKWPYKKLHHRQKIGIKTEWKCELHLEGSGQSPATDFYEDDNELSHSTISWPDK